MKLPQTIKCRLHFLGLKEVDWDKYDFHLTPVLTYTRINRQQSKGYALSLELGHWALSLQIFIF
jgi:hypothetical protein